MCFFRRRGSCVICRSEVHFRDFVFFSLGGVVSSGARFLFGGAFLWCDLCIDVGFVIEGVRSFPACVVDTVCVVAFASKRCALVLGGEWDSLDFASVLIDY